MTEQSLVARLREHAECHRSHGQDGEQKQWADDLETAAAELERLQSARAEPATVERLMALADAFADSAFSPYGKQDRAPARAALESALQSALAAQREPVSSDAVGEAVRAYIQAGKRGLDLMGAMKCALEAAAPSPAAQPLTDEQISALILPLPHHPEHAMTWLGTETECIARHARKVARSVERAHGIGAAAGEKP